MKSKPDTDLPETSNRGAKGNQENLFDRLPNELLPNIEKRLPLPSQAAFAKTCYRFYDYGLNDTPATLFCGPHNTRIREFKECREFREKVHQLLSACLHGEFKKVDVMLAQCPELLLEKGIAKDDANRTIEGTVYRMALGAKDVSLDPSKHDEMVEMIKRHFEKLADGEAEMARQRAAQFPEGWEQQEKARKEADSAALKKVFAAIGQSTNNTEARAGIAEFKQYLAKQKEGVIKTGFHFNDQLFVEALQLYEDHYTQFGVFDSRKNRLAAIEVVGSIETYFTACLAQAACDGFGKVVDNKLKLSRSLMLGTPANYPFFHPELGKSHFVYSYYTVQGDRLAGAEVAFRRCSFQNLCRAKTASLGELRSPRRDIVAGAGVQFSKVMR